MVSGTTHNPQTPLRSLDLQAGDGTDQAVPGPRPPVHPGPQQPLNVLRCIMLEPQPRRWDHTTMCRARATRHSAACYHTEEKGNYALGRNIRAYGRSNAPPQPVRRRVV